MAARILDMTGKVCGRLKVIGLYDDRVKDGRKGVFWKTVCECGKETIVEGYELRRGHTKSCGCLKVEYGSEKKIVGTTEIKITPEILIDIRKMVKMTPGMKQYEQTDLIADKYPQFAPKSIPGYIVCANVSDKVFQMYLDGKFSMGTLRVLGGCESSALSDFLADEFIERHMTVGQLEEAKAIMKRKDAKSWDDALKMATKEYIPEIEPPKPRKTKYQTMPGALPEAPKSFEDLLNDILTSGTLWRMKVQMAIDMAPFAPQSGYHNWTVFNKIYMLRHTLKENFEFVDQRVKEYLDQMLQMGNVAQGNGSDAAQTAKENEHVDATTGRSADDGTEGRGTGDQGLPEGSGQAVPPSGPGVVQA